VSLAGAIAAPLAALALQAGQTDEPAAPSSSGAPASIDDLLGQTPMTEDAREAAVRAAYAAAQARRGGLDGRWRLEARDGRTLYVFQLSDPGFSPDPRSSTPGRPVIEGAWRDPARDGTHQGSGFLSSVERDGAALVVRFVDHNPDCTQDVSLRQRADGVWVGTLEGETASQTVTMRRF
jgi:hypothetical protein